MAASKCPRDGTALDIYSENTSLGGLGPDSALAFDLVAPTDSGQANRLLKSIDDQSAGPAVTRRAAPSVLSASDGQMKTCPACGLQLKPSTKVCPRDGTNLIYAAVRAAHLQMSQLEISGETAATRPPSSADSSAKKDWADTSQKNCPTCGLRICPHDGTDLREFAIDADFRSRYEFLETIGAGGMGVIYKARDLKSNDLVAIKMLHSHLESTEAVARFQVEVKATRLLSHPYIVSIRDFGTTTAHQPYLVMDYVDGETLSQILSRYGRISLERFLKLFAQVCDALNHAHERKVLHRDIKPSNIMVLRGPQGSEEIRIMDFGIAKLMDDSAPRGQHLTKTGEAIGSPIYMSPEQARGEKVDHRADIYSLGCVMYESLTGRPPLVGESALDTLLMHMQQQPPPMASVVHNANIDPFYDQIVLRLLEKEPANRYQSMSVLAKDLQALEKARTSGKKLKQLPSVVARETASKPKKNYSKIAFAGLAISVLVVASVFFVFRYIDQANQKKESIINKADVMSSATLAPKAMLTGFKYFTETDSADQLHELLSREIVDLREYIKGRDLVGRPFSDKDMEQLRFAKLAKIMYIKFIPITDKGFVWLTHLTQLENLDLGSTAVRELPGIEKMTGLRHLSLEKTSVNTVGIRRLTNLQLTDLDLSKTTITGSDLKVLYGMKSLTQINVARCPNIDELDVLELRQHFPLATIFNTTILGEAAKKKLHGDLQGAAGIYLTIVHRLRTKPNPDQKMIASLLDDLGTCQFLDKSLNPAAAASFSEETRILQRVDPHGIKLALGLTHLAGCYEQTDHMDLSKAAEKREAARLVLDRNFATAQDKKTIEALMDLNEELLICDYVNQNKLEQGKQVLAQMKQRFKHNQRQTNDQIIAAENNLAAHFFRERRFAEALPLYEEQETYYARPGQPNPSAQLYNTEWALGRVYAQLKKPARAEKMIQRCLALSQFGAPKQRQEQLLLLAKVLKEQGKVPEAKAVEQQAAAN